MKDDIQPLTPGQREIMAKIGSPELTAADIAHGIPHDEREQRCQAVSGDAEGKVPTTALDERRVSREAIRPPGSGVDELEYWRGNAMHYHGLCVALEDEIDNYILALDGKDACIRRRNEWLAEERGRLEKAEQDKCGLAADALNARQLLREFMAYVKCGQVPEDAHCVRLAKQLLRSAPLEASDSEAGGGGAEQAGDEQGESQSGARSATQ